MRFTLGAFMARRNPDAALVRAARRFADAVHRVIEAVEEMKKAQALLARTTSRDGQVRLSTLNEEGE